MTDIAKKFEKAKDALKEIEKLEDIETLLEIKTSDSDYSIDKTMFFISACLTCAELNTRSLKNKNYITDKELQKFSKKINELRKNYKDLFSTLKNTDVSYAW
jgi:hypothetical protein